MTHQNLLIGRDALRALPKVELHTHLDTSVSFETVRGILPETTLADYRAHFVGPPKCRDLADFLGKIEPAIDLLQTEKALRLAMREHIRQSAEDGAVYVEVRFAPLLNERKGLRIEEVVECSLDAMRAACADHGIAAGLILCTLRHYTAEQSLQTAALVARYADQGVVGFDLAADEAGFPLDNHVEAFARTNALGLNTTAHAGEACGADSVRETLERLKPRRIGHGVRAIEDMEVVDLLVARNIHLEVCPTSNVQIDVVPTYADHPIDKLRRLDVPLGINTDGRAVSDITLTEEYARLNEVFGWGEAEFRAANLAALDASFAPDDIKAAVRGKLLGLEEPTAA